MAILSAALTVTPMSSTVTGIAADDQSTPLGVYVQLRGSAATSTVSACRVKAGDTYVDLTTTHSTAGEVTATLTSANLDTLGAAAANLTFLTAWWSGTVTDGAGVQTWHYQQPLVVSDRQFRFALRMEDIITRLPMLARSSTIMAGESSHWRMVELALRDVARSIDDRTNARTYLMTHPQQVQRVAELEVCAFLAETLGAHDAGQSVYLMSRAKQWRKDAEAEWARLEVLVKESGTAWQTPAPVTPVGVNVNDLFRPGGSIGGIL